MTKTDIRERITDHFSDSGDQSDIWRGFDLFLNTDAFLNLGYSRWYQPHFAGSSQRRLAENIGTVLAAHLPATDGVSLLVVGAGRGGPTIHLADRFGFRIVGIDLVPYNVARARANARRENSSAEFIIADGTELPVLAESVAACGAIDSIVYIPDKRGVFESMERVLEPNGIVVVSDLVIRSSVTDAERQTSDAFADAWDMPPLSTKTEYRTAITDAGLDVLAIEDVSSHSIARFRKWTTLYLALVSSPLSVLVDRLLRWVDLDPETITKQIRRAHDALPHLQHVVVTARK